MAVNALELRPRTTLALFDAALRLCGRTLGVWAITLPAGAGLVAATFELVDAVKHHRGLALPAAYFTAAWLFRAISQGAATDYLERLILEPTEPSARASFWAALKRAPALFYAAGFCLFLNALVWCFSLGIGYLLLGAHLAAYAVVMKGRGSLLGLYGTCSRMLGPARHAASWLRLSGLTQIIVALNIHLGVTAALAAASKLLALNVTFVSRFASFDNPVWLAAVAALTFSLFEPVRAACASLLLIDGRVRQEGLDLLTQLEQLPQRRKPRAQAAAIAFVLVACVLAPAVAQAGDDWSGVYVPGQHATPTTTAMSGRLKAVVEDCGLQARFPNGQLKSVDALPEASQAALSRFVARVERVAWDEENCEGAADELKRGLDQIDATAADARAGNATATRDDAQQVLTQPEFAVDPPQVKKPDEPPAEEGPFAKWFRELWESFLKWLFGPDRREHHTSMDLSVPSLGLSNLVMFAAIGLVIGLLLWLLLRGLSRANDDELTASEAGGIVQTPLAPDPMNALSRPPEGWAGIADELAAKGLYRDAIRNLYLALLSRLHRDGAIDYDPAKSNWDYFRGFKGPMSALTPFRDLTRRFDFAWYGNLEVSHDAWLTFRSITQPLLSGASPQVARVA